MPENPAPSTQLATRFGMVAVVGRPNAGKSTLINHLIGQKISIVSEKPQTTRHRILGIRTSEKGQLVFVDTPGIHRPLFKLNRRMLRTAMTSLEDSDVALLLVDASEGFGRGDKFVIEAIKTYDRPLLVLLNKIDLIRKSRLLPLMSMYGEALPAAEIIPLSALRGDNASLVESRLWELAPEGEPMFPAEQITDRSNVFRAAEIVREKILNHTREELPWATAVRIDQDEVEGDLWRLYFSILVEKRSQRAIVIGKGGSFLKMVGTEAREEIEKVFGRKVYLSLQVEHEERWRDSPRQLALLELGDDG
ncbi:MAG: GTPase Era [Acidobacteria bacterium]|nr:GTPase Era [Acidobacteriota bacterium]